MAIANGRVEVVVAGKRQRIMEWSTPVELVDVQADANNGDVICIGGPDVIAALADCNSLEIRRNDILTLHDVDLYDVWVDARVSGEALKWLQRA